MKRIVVTLLLAAGLLHARLAAQAPDTMLVPVAVTINAVIQGDTLANGERQNPHRVYLLERGGYYILHGPITVQQGTRLRVEGQPPPPVGPDPGMAVIIEGEIQGEMYVSFFDCYGDLTLKNLWLVFATTAGRRQWTSIMFERDSLQGEFDNCMFDYCMAPVVYVSGKHFRGIFSNSIFRNDIDPSQWWAGRQITFSGTASADSIATVNCTLENMAMGYQSDFVPARRVWFNHNTFLNIARYAFKEISWTWFVCTNNIFVNCNFAGERAIDRSGVLPDPEIWGAVLNVDTLPAAGLNGVQENGRVILFSHNSNYCDPMFQNFYTAYNQGMTTPADTIMPEPLMNARTTAMFASHPLMRMSNVYDGLNPRFTVPATSRDSILAFLRARYIEGGSVFWGFHPDINAEWPLQEDLSYTNDTLRTSGMGGFPLGDLYHWFPDRYPAWESQAADEAGRILGFTGVKREMSRVPATATLDQNWPNPFNPKTAISYELTAGSFVSLRVYDVLGREVATLVHQFQKPGRYTASFDASGLASGMYLCRLEAGGLVSARKMLLLR